MDLALLQRIAEWSIVAIVDPHRVVEIYKKSTGIVVEPLFFLKAVKANLDRITGSGQIIMLTAWRLAAQPDVSKIKRLNKPDAYHAYRFSSAGALWSGWPGSLGDLALPGWLGLPVVVCPVVTGLSGRRCIAGTASGGWASPAIL